MKKIVQVIVSIALFIYLLDKYEFYAALAGGILLALLVILGGKSSNNQGDSPYPWWYLFTEKENRK